MINENCPCKRKCDRHGNCDECRAHHADKKHPPICERDNGKRQRKQKLTSDLNPLGN